MTSKKNPADFRKNFGTLQRSFSRLPVPIDAIKKSKLTKRNDTKSNIPENGPKGIDHFIDLTNAIQKDNDKRLGIFQFSRFVSESLCKLVESSTLQPYQHDFEVLKRIAILLFYAPFASSSQKTGNYTYSQYQFRLVIHKILSSSFCGS